MYNKALHRRQWSAAELPPVSLVVRPAFDRTTTWPRWQPAQASGAMSSHFPRGGGKTGLRLDAEQLTRPVDGLS